MWGIFLRAPHRSQDAYFLHPSDLTWHQSSPLGAAAVALLTPRPPGLAISTLIIRNGRDFRIVQAVQAVKLGSFDLMVLTKTNISTSVYCRNRLVYDIFLSAERPSGARGPQGGVVLVSWVRPTGWSLE